MKYPAPNLVPDGTLTTQAIVALIKRTGGIHNRLVLFLGELSADPDDPSEGESIIWQSDGTGAGDDGDIMIKITAGGVTKTGTLVDFSAL